MWQSTECLPPRIAPHTGSCPALALLLVLSPLLLYRFRNLWPPFHAEAGVINPLRGHGGKYVDLVVQHHARQLLVGCDLSETLNRIEDHSYARTIRDQTIKKCFGDRDRQLRLSDSGGAALLRNEQ